MKNPVPIRANTNSAKEKRMTLTWILAGIILNKSGKTKKENNDQVTQEALGKMIVFEKYHLVIILDEKMHYTACN